MDEKLDKSQQCVLATQEASHILGFIKGSVASRPRELSLPSCSAPPLLPPGLSSPAQESQGSVGACQEEAMKMIQGLEHLSCKDRLRAGAVHSGEQEAPGRS